MADEAKPDEAAPEGEAEPAEVDAEAAPAEAEAETGQAETDAEPVPEEEADAIDLDEAKAWAGMKLDELGGHSVGRVEGVYVDDATGEPEWLLARMGRFGHHCLVPARDAVAAGGRVWVPYSRDQIRKAPRIEPNRALERDREQALLEHYGVGTGEVGRGAQLAEREATAITARPA